MNRLKKIWQDIKKPLTLISNTDNQKELEQHEIWVSVILLVPMLLSGVIIAAIVGVLWEKSLFQIILSSSSLFLASILMIIAVKVIKNKNLVRHTIGFLTTIISIITYWVFFENIGSLYWILVITLFLVSSIKTTSINIIYNFLTLFITLILSFIYFKNGIYIADTTYYLTLSIALIFIIVIIMILNRIYKKIIQNKMNQNIKLEEYNDSILKYSRELEKNEKKLIRQNKQLNVYNKEIIKQQEKLEYLAYRDSLTGLINRKRMIEELSLLIEFNRNSNFKFAIAFLDLDDFKKINDSLGHIVGDRVLEKLSYRIKSIIDKKDLIGRIGGDEFALIIKRDLSEIDLRDYINKIVEEIKRGIKIDNYIHNVGVSVGIAVWPLDGETSKELFQAADTAMYKVKNRGKGDIQFFRRYMKEEMLKKIEMEKQLLNALDNNELFVAFQPIINSKSNDIHGFEALMRWNSKVFGTVTPDEFIPITEEMGIVYDFGLWIIEMVCLMMKDIKQILNKDYNFSINLSAVQFKNPNLYEDVKTILDKNDINPNNLIFEITESIFINDVNNLSRIISKFKALGIKIALDDFGTGYSSLNYLLDIPVDYLKVDKSFTDKLLTENRKKDIMKSIIQMAHDLQMIVVVEGVEEKKQVEYLKTYNCDAMQGYYYSKPIRADSVIDSLMSPII